MSGRFVGDIRPLDQNPEMQAEERGFPQIHADRRDIACAPERIDTLDEMEVAQLNGHNL